MKKKEDSEKGKQRKSSWGSVKARPRKKSSEPVYVPSVIYAYAP